MIFLHADWGIYMTQFLETNVTKIYLAKFTWADFLESSLGYLRGQAASWNPILDEACLKILDQHLFRELSDMKPCFLSQLIDFGKVQVDS